MAYMFLDSLDDQRHLNNLILCSYDADLKHTLAINSLNLLVFSSVYNEPRKRSGTGTGTGFSFELPGFAIL